MCRTADRLSLFLMLQGILLGQSYTRYSPLKRERSKMVLLLISSKKLAEVITRTNARNHTDTEPNAGSSQPPVPLGRENFFHHLALLSGRWSLR